MKIVKPNAQLINKDEFNHAFKFIEKVGRTCYKSESKITNESADKFIRNLVDRKHFSVLEHWHEHLKLSEEVYRNLMYIGEFHHDLFKYFSFSPLNTANYVYMSGSLRAFKELFENAAEKGILKGHIYFGALHFRLHENYPIIFGDLPWDVPSMVLGQVIHIDSWKHLNDIRIDEAMKHYTHTIRFTCDRGVSHELVRHRPVAISQESTRYCNYGHDGEITVIEPVFWERATVGYNSWFEACQSAEKIYMSLLAGGATPQEARAVLPNSLKTEVVMTATEEEWQHIVNLRYLGTTGAPHPQMKQVMEIAAKELWKASSFRIRLEVQDD